MGFSSISFLFYFLPPFFLVYYLVPRRLKNIVALLGSLAFYAWGEPRPAFCSLRQRRLPITVSGCGCGGRGGLPSRSG